MGNHWFVGVDIGGTTIKMAFIDTYGEIKQKWEIPTNCEHEGKQITTDISKSIFGKLDELDEPKEKLAGIGVGAPGFINMETGLIYRAVNIGWTNFPLKDRLEVETGLPVVVDNDANLAALGEMWRGAGDGSKNLLAVTLGTGVGGGLIANGNILHGVNGMAGEIGHITSMATGGAHCNCGKSGCLETIASATGIARLATEAVEKNNDSVLADVFDREGKLTAKDVFDAAKNDDRLALNVIDEMSFHLGIAIANLAIATNPEKIVLGGGVSKAGELLLRYVRKHFEAYALPRVAEGAEITIATLGNDAGVIGGVWLIKQKVDNAKSL
ncbi:glucokinase [Anaerobacillus arseniciselenatis]|uniref:Glucokinase n=1 Tax=Anaerobacillus arseniciselenatis TaxID=85682 RepID=A0A1S2LU73_9BACI|nr:ROK family glucokinase [Anaerobacillus arseniciselenatis]OIJ16082.1 glucokinase [Anaerobacillus arseniciselenatis]